MDEFRKLFKAHKQGKIERLQTILTIKNKLESEIINRDFTDIPTDKLLALSIKYNEYLDDHIDRENKSSDFDKSIDDPWIPIV